VALMTIGCGFVKLAWCFGRMLGSYPLLWLWSGMVIRYAHVLVGALFFVAAPSLAADQGAGETQVAQPSGRGWSQLFDGKSLRGWYTKIQNQKTGEDPEKYFQVVDGMIHVYKDQAAGAAVPSGYIATEAAYANYHLRMEYKWGAKKFKPRMMAVRDAGLLYHVRPPDTVWPRCVECQIQEGDTGDCFTVRGVQLVTSVEVVPIQTPGGMKKLPRYRAEADGGETRKIGDSGIARIVKSSTREREGWNTVEIIVRGRHGSEHIVNGETVFRAKDFMQLGPDAQESARKKGEVDTRKWEPLAEGRIALQCEFAEVFYRNIEIRGIAEGPLEGKAK
jgi:Domain of Unknown Function (DUF1080)